MEQKKKIFWIFGLFLLVLTLSLPVKAALISNVTAMYLFNGTGDLSDETGTYNSNGTVGTVTKGVEGKFGKCWKYPVGAYSEFGAFGNTTMSTLFDKTINNSEFTIVMTANKTVGNNAYPISISDSVPSKSFAMEIDDSGAEEFLRNQWEADAGFSENLQSDVVPHGLHTYVYRLGPYGFEMFIDNMTQPVLIDASITGKQAITGAMRMRFGARAWTAGTAGEVHLCEITFLNVSIGNATLRTLNYTNASAAFSFVVPVTQPLTIKVKDKYDATEINNFSITVVNSTHTITNSTTTKSIVLSNVFQGLYNITITGINQTGEYFNVTLKNFIVTKTIQPATNEFTANATQAIATIFVTDLSNGQAIDSFTVVTNLTTVSTTNGRAEVQVKAGVFTLNVTATGFEKLSTTFTRIALQNESVNVSIGSVFKFNLIREETGSIFDINSTNSTELNIFCSNFTSKLVFKNLSLNLTNQSAVINCVPTLMQIVVDYGASGSYFRTLIPPVTQKNVTWYLIDLNLGDVAIQRIITLLDLTGEFANSVLRVKRAVSGTTETIIEQRFDISDEVNLFLVKDALYTINIENDVRETGLGNLIPTEAGTQTITLPKLDFQPQEIVMGGNISWSYTFNIATNILRLQYLDLTGKTTLVRLKVFNGSNLGQVLFNNEAVGSSDVTLTFNQVFENKSYATELFFQHPDLSNFTENNVFYEANPGTAGLINLEGWTTSAQRDIKKWFAYIFLVVWILMFARRYIGIGMASMIIWLWIFRIFGWVDVSNLIFGFLVLMAVTGWLVQQMRQN